MLHPFKSHSPVLFGSNRGTMLTSLLAKYEGACVKPYFLAVQKIQGVSSLNGQSVNEG